MEIKRSKQTVVQETTIEAQHVELSCGYLCGLVREAVSERFPNKKIKSIAWETKIERVYSRDAGMGSGPESEHVNVLGVVVELEDDADCLTLDR
jgi:hypothetical protein